jgi:hypothetical protein
MNFEKLIKRLIRDETRYLSRRGTINRAHSLFPKQPVIYSNPIGNLTSFVMKWIVSRVRVTHKESVKPDSS